MKYLVKSNKDSALAFVAALDSADFQRVDWKHRDEADIFLYDTENVGRRRDAIRDVLSHAHGFIYPHTPLTCWLWDGIYEPLPVSCNFVAGQAQKKAMKEYGYPSRVEVVGFPRCEVLPFKKTTGRNVLFVPARPRKDEGRQERDDKRAFEFLVKNRDSFGDVTVCHVGQYDDVEIDDRFVFIRDDIKQNPNPAKTMMERVDAADLIISCNTPAVLGVARGKPTVFYGEETTPETNTGRVPKNYGKYSQFLKFPLNLSDMTIEEVINVRSSKNEDVEKWKRGNVGKNFDAAKFLEIVKGCLDGTHK